MDYRITVRMERRITRSSRFKLFLKTTSATVLSEDDYEDHKALDDLFAEITQAVRDLRLPGREALIADIKARLDGTSTGTKLDEITNDAVIDQIAQNGL